MQCLRSQVLQKQRQDRPPIGVSSDPLHPRPKRRYDNRVVAQLIYPKARGHQTWPILPNRRPHTQFSPIVEPFLVNCEGEEKLFSLRVESQDLDPGQLQHLMTHRSVSTEAGRLAAIARITHRAQLTATAVNNLFEISDPPEPRAHPYRAGLGIVRRFLSFHQRTLNRLPRPQPSLQAEEQPHSVDGPDVNFAALEAL